MLWGPVRREGEFNLSNGQRFSVRRNEITPHTRNEIIERGKSSAGIPIAIFIFIVYFVRVLYSVDKLYEVIFEVSVFRDLLYLDTRDLHLEYSLPSSSQLHGAIYILRFIRKQYRN